MMELDEVTRDTINEVGTVLIGLATLLGGGWFIDRHATDAGLVGIGAGAIMLVLGFFFNQRASSKATNGTLNALNAIAGQIGSNAQIIAENQAKAVALATQQASIQQAAAVSQAVKDAKAGP